MKILGTILGVCIPFLTMGLIFLFQWVKFYWIMKPKSQKEAYDLEKELSLFKHLRESTYHLYSWNQENFENAYIYVVEYLNKLQLEQIPKEESIFKRNVYREHMMYNILYVIRKIKDGLEVKSKTIPLAIELINQIEAIPLSLRIYYEKNKWYLYNSDDSESFRKAYNKELKEKLEENSARLRLGEDALAFVS